MSEMEGKTEGIKKLMSLLECGAKDAKKIYEKYHPYAVSGAYRVVLQENDDATLILKEMHDGSLIYIVENKIRSKFTVISDYNSEYPLMKAISEFNSLKHCY